MFLEHRQINTTLEISAATFTALVSMTRVVSSRTVEFKLSCCFCWCGLNGCHPYELVFARNTE